MAKSKTESFKDFDEAYASVQGTRINMVMKFKPFIETGFGLDDLFAVADEAIVKAWKTWKPEESKFNTYAQNMMNWDLNNFMNHMNTTFMINDYTKYELRQENETFETIKEAGKTKDEAFNKEHNLDGDPEKITRNIWNSYVYYQTRQRRDIVSVSPTSNFTSQDGDEFDITEMSPEVAEASAKSNEYKYDGFEMDSAEFEDTLSKLEGDKKKIAEMLISGMTIGEIAKEYKMSKAKFLRVFGGESTGTKGKAKQAKEKAKMEFLAKQKAKKEAREASMA